MATQAGREMSSEHDLYKNFWCWHVCLNHTYFERWKWPLIHSEFRANKPSHLVNEEILRKVYRGEMSMGKTRKRLAIMVRVYESCILRCYGVTQTENVNLSSSHAVKYCCLSGR